MEGFNVFPGRCVFQLDPFMDRLLRIAYVWSNIIKTLVSVGVERCLCARQPMPLAPSLHGIRCRGAPFLSEYLFILFCSEPPLASPLPILPVFPPMESSSPFSIGSPFIFHYTPWRGVSSCWSPSFFD